MVADPAAAAADVLLGAVAGGGHVALAGGSTPRAAYQRAAAAEADWSRVVLWFGDERCVPPDDERSNFRMVREALLDPLGAAAPAVRRIEGERGADVAAAAYERELRTAFGGQPVRLDLILLGLGPDVHTASLFPGVPALDVDDAQVAAVEVAGREPRVPRVTLTYPALNAAREVVFLVSGEDKAEAVERAFAAPPSRDAPG